MGSYILSYIGEENNRFIKPRAKHARAKMMKSLFVERAI